MLLYEKWDKIVVMTLNRPERLNALSEELCEKITEGLERFRDDDDAWVLVLTGTGDRAFCGGRDLRELAEQKKKGKWSPKFEISHKLGMGVWKPIIAAINGYCVAGGFRLAQLCDVRIRP